MKFVRYGPSGVEKPGFVDGAGQIRDLSDVIDDLAGSTLGRLPRLNPSNLTALDGVYPIVPGTTRLGVPIANVGKVVCVGLNYTDHAAEMGLEPPEEPVLFLKATSALNGPFDPVLLPPGSTKTDWEVELGIVIGRRATRVTEQQAMSHVVGYTIVNDVSERHLQLERGGQWTKGKSCDTFCPVGPWIVTPDEVPKISKAGLSLHVNGKQMQSGSTERMIFTPAQIVSYISQIMTLHPGDIIATGTPPGVGGGHKPPVFLGAGDVMEAAIDGLGQQRSKVMAS